MYDENSNVALVLNNAAALQASTAMQQAAAAAAASVTTTVMPGGAASANSQHLMSQLMNVKDSRWLQLEVCREFQRGQCLRTDLECKFAHPPAYVDVQNGRVTACYDSIKVFVLFFFQ